jgi:hypothetical protein
MGARGFSIQFRVVIAVSPRGLPLGTLVSHKPQRLAVEREIVMDGLEHIQ